MGVAKVTKGFFVITFCDRHREFRRIARIIAWPSTQRKREAEELGMGLLFLSSFVRFLHSVKQLRGVSGHDFSRAVRRALFARL
jgi:hypothetical protein